MCDSGRRGKVNMMCSVKLWRLCSLLPCGLWIEMSLIETRLNLKYISGPKTNKKKTTAKNLIVLT